MKIAKCQFKDSAPVEAWFSKKLIFSNVVYSGAKNKKIIKKQNFVKMILLKKIGNRANKVILKLLKYVKWTVNTYVSF